MAASSVTTGTRSGAGGGIGLTSKNLREFLASHKITTDETALITHTRIPSEEHKVYGGSYHIPNDHMPEFYEHYYNHVFVRREAEYLTEKQLSGQSGEPCGPVLVDFDFRYAPDVRERQHDSTVIEDLMSLYAEKISMIMDIPENTSVTFYVFEKPSANTRDTAVTKDGIHFVISIPMPRDGQRLLRELVKGELMGVLSSLPLTNDADKILDAGITNGHTNWQLFGSRKPGHDSYEMTHIVEFKAGPDGTLAPDNVVSVDSVNRRQLLRLTSARNDLRNNDGPAFELSEYAKEKIGKMDTSSATRRKASTFRLISGATQKMSTIEELEAAVDDFLKGLKHEDYILREVHEYTMALPNHFSDDYHTWIQTGLALHNTDRRLFLSWMMFSSRSEKFDFADIPKYRNMWDYEFKEAVGGLTYRSIIYWLRRENKAEYDRIHSNTIDYFVTRTLTNHVTPREFDFAMVLYEMFKNEYRCASVKYNTWFVFENHRWKEVDSGNTIRFSISSDLRKVYVDKLDKYLTKSGGDEGASTSGAASSTSIVPHPYSAGGSAAAAAAAAGGSSHTEEKNGQSPMVMKCMEYCSKMNETTWKNNMMKEVKEIFYRKDPDFYKMANTKRHLLCFNNGVVDFEKKEFRDGLPEDYITMTTGINYVRFNAENPNHVRIKAEIEEFLHQLFPVDELYEYMWDHLASTLMGSTKAQTFTIYNGCGRNGKSALVELMGLVLGDYKGTVPITAVTQKRTNIGSASPEIAKLCGVRYAVMQEPTKGDKLNDGIMKELTGGDPIQSRPLYKEPIEFVPQFKLVVCTNNLFDINTDDDGTWRRIKLVDFMSRFVHEIKGEAEYEFKVILDMSSKFETWKEIFASLLVERAYKTEGNVPDCEMVLKASNQYRQRQNVFAEFVSDSLGKRKDGDDTPPLRLDDAWASFKVWYQDAYGKTPPKRKELEQFLEKTLGKMSSSGKRKQWDTYYLKVGSAYDDGDDDM
jgi:P4 family phage/plasmid primase-like protien